MGIIFTFPYRNSVLGLTYWLSFVVGAREIGLWVVVSGQPAKAGLQRVKGKFEDWVW